MKYSPIDSKLFIQNRNRLYQWLKPDSLCILHSNDLMPTNADGTFLFRQNNDLFYLSGIDQEATILLLFPDAPKQEWREILFIKETNEYIVTWEGHKLSKEEARKTSGISQVYWSGEFESVLHSLIFESTHIYLNLNEHTRAETTVPTREIRFAHSCREKYPLHQYERLTPILSSLRSVKQETEIALTQRAIDITEKAFRRTLGFVKPGVIEYEIEAEIIHEFIRNGADGHAYSPIIASGSSACILHYTENNRVCYGGDLLLLDFGASYANYAADLTRTVPVNGKFTQRQKDVYNAVLRILYFAKTLLVAGNTLEKYHKETGRFVEEELIELGLLNREEVQKQNPEKPLYKQFFMHGVSHYLGLDVHDVGSRFAQFKPGMLFTCEPGIYIKEEGLGVRLENNILLIDQGNIDLTQKIPITIEEIEGYMSSSYSNL